MVKSPYNCVIFSLTQPQVANKKMGLGITKQGYQQSRVASKAGRQGCIQVSFKHFLIMEG